MKINRYPVYKNSGIEWIGEVPEHWEVRRVKEFAMIVNGSTPKSSVPENWDGNYAWVTTDDLGKLRTKFITDSKRTITEIGFKSCGTTLCPKDSIVLSSRAPIGHIGVLTIQACTNQGCKTLVVNQRIVNSLFIFYSILSSKEKLQALGKGTTFIELSTKELSLFSLPVPPLSEQKVIAHYLDAKTAQIDRKIDLLAQKAALYSNLKESLINETVTRGLDKSVRMRDRGIEWIGEVPEHWEVRRVKEFAMIVNGSTPKSSVPENWDGNYAWVTTDDLGKLRTKFITDSKRTITEIGFKSCGTTLCPKDSIVLSSRAPIGHIGVLTIQACTNQGCKTLVVNQRIVNSLFIFYSILSSKEKLQALGKGTTFIELSTKELSLFSLPVPPLSEQKVIAHYLDAKTAQIDQIIQTINTQIEKLKELRKTLINDAVTGKIKVV